ncbi:hypothetical protein MJH70_22910, partial [Salmonella enterica subsp. enterica serovar Kentucky]|nr:hypothetical protein [Salmonella enterica subsp. enterica serovar Kentucky]
MEEHSAHYRVNHFWLYTASVTKVFEKAAKKEPQPLYTFSLPLLSVQDEIRVYCKKKNIKIG